MTEEKVRYEIRIATTEAEREAIYRFRYSVYVDEMGKSLSYADEERKMLYDALDASAEHFMGLVNGEVVACARLNQASDPNLDEELRDLYRLDAWAEFQPEAVSLSSRLMVAQPWRGSAVLGSLLLELYRYSRERGIRFNFLNCAPSLLDLYEQMGYRRYADGFIDPDVGYRIPMVFMAEDVDYMKQVHSPFYRLARKLPGSTADSLWFEQKFPEHAIHINRRLIDSDQFWDMLENNLHADPKSRISLLSGLSDADAQQFLNTGTVMVCKAGDIIIRPGDVGDEMFVVLEGAVEVWGGNDQHPVSLAMLGPGQVFGEIAFVSRVPRTAKVVAVNDVKLLVLTQNFLRKALKTMPQIVAPVLLNLSVVLCDRLKASTQHWMEAVQKASQIEEAIR
jgi:CRP-like cAMP-binding protein/predicted GNAT family N-acyltransferase